MAFENNLNCVSIAASGDMSTTGQYRFVTVGASGRIAVTGAGQAADGVLQDKPAAAGRPGSVAISGISKILVGAGGVTAGDDVASGANGVAVTATTGDVVNAKALETASNGTIASFLLTVGNREPLA